MSTEPPGEAATDEHAPAADAKSRSRDHSPVELDQAATKIQSRYRAKIVQGDLLAGEQRKRQQRLWQIMVGDRKYTGLATIES